MDALGLSKDECVTISIVAPIIAVIGPLVAAPLADRLAGGFGGSSRSKTGRYLRVMLAVCFALATLFYWLLLTVPPIHRSPPNVTFMCNEKGGFILQDRCGAERTCYNWNGEKGSVIVTNCIFTCNATTLYKKETTTLSPEQLTSSETTTEDYYDETNDTITVYNEAEIEVNSAPVPEVVTPSVDSANAGISLSPHMCYNNQTDGPKICEVYTEYSKNVTFSLSLKPNMKRSSENETEDDICRYPFADYFHCRIPEATAKDLVTDNPDCEPIVLCEIRDPYDNENSLLKKSKCGYNNISFWLYLFIRSIADIFPAAAVALLSTAVVIATRETSTGRGDIGKQLAAGALGFAIFAPIIGGAAGGKFLAAMICFTVLMALAILILLFDNKMPLSPPEWWWHTRCGLLALPMSSVRKYGFEIAALGIILFLLGIFWNAIDAFLPGHIVNLKGTALIIGLTITTGALPAVILFIFAEKIVDYCSHSNILILCFVSYIIHHVSLLHIDVPGLLLIIETLEIFTLHLMWITAILYLRHLVPRKFTACGQALPVVTHFCLGRCIGALIGGLAHTESSKKFKDVHLGFTIAAAVIATVYFFTYHFFLKPRCAAQPQLPPYPAPSVVQSMNGNGSYTPLRVYHNGRAKKGHFRY
ncbi:uncharacterized protein BDFB_009230, partial [Asbolus verrucosus]